MPARLRHRISQALGPFKAEITTSACVMQPARLPLGVLHRAGADRKSISNTDVWDGPSFGILVLGWSILKDPGPSTGGGASFGILVLAPGMGASFGILVLEWDIL